MLKMAIRWFLTTTQRFTVIFAHPGPMWDLDIAREQPLARTVRDRIQQTNDYDLLADIRP